uniref:Carboxylesterase type B domain-containing protein n=1 Tax=Anas platyrhynchos platyrhynchos TaxID=8840 RepID=A0A493TQ70_ANAPP
AFKINYPGKMVFSSVTCKRRYQPDCLSLQVKNMSVLLFFHNGGSGNTEAGKTTIDGSYLAAISNTIVVTASYRVGVFGFLSTGK